MFFFFFENEEYQNMGELLKAKRLKKGLNQSELAEKMGVSQQSITYYESNKRIPSEKVINNYASVLGINPDQLHHLRTQAVLEKAADEAFEESRKHIDFDEQFKSVISSLKHDISQHYGSIDLGNDDFTSVLSLDGEAISQEEIEKATEYIRALRIMKDQNK
ncbi:helix-turn-helix domain-containing protein [Lysinibacillus sp. RC79]|uniref:helix-turn-helix domain-containing protein n=1 Tax=Lysinibacillus sp. RC79 TaxID=3156296 RepID=UPI0035151515